MVVMNATAARANFFQIVRTMDGSSEPITVTSKDHNVVIVSEDEWKDIQETLYLHSIPGLTDKIKAGLDAKPNELYSDEEVWGD